MVCTVCINALQWGWSKGLARSLVASEVTDEDQFRIAHHQNLDSLAASASEACLICLRLWDAIGGEMRQTINDEDVMKLQTWLKKKDKFCDEYYLTYFSLSGPSRLGEHDVKEFLTTLSVTLNSLVLHRSQSSIKKNIRIPEVYFFLSAHENEIQHLRSARVHSRSTSSAEALAQASTWVQKCVATHRSCMSSRNPDWYPTRLVDVGDNSSSCSHIRLIETAGEHPAGPYATLSHCWGSANFIKLERSTVNHFQKGIPMIELPKTFRDAITVARHLGIRYLWIDSLCILQDEDDTSDWLKEASLMREVYAGSYCNLSALAARDSAEGLFFDRDPRVSHAQIKLRAKELGYQQDYLDCDVVERYFWKDHVSGCVINKRAWVLQERVLPPRVLHFGREQLFWECKETDAAETYPDGLPGFLEMVYYTNFKNLDLATRNKGSRSRASWHNYDSVSGYHELWHILVYAYSEARMTKPSDKLIALSGLAKEFAVLTQDIYVVGMWQKFLASELLWRALYAEGHDVNPTSRPSTYRAPSFSWASIDGAVVFSQATNSNLLIEVVDVQLKHVTDDVTGLVSDGFLDLKGQLKPVRILARTWRTRQVYDLESDGVMVGGPRESHRQSLEVLIDVDPKGFESENTAQALYYMPVAIDIQPHTDSLQLLLFEVASREQGTFRRIGIARTRQKEDISQLLQKTTEPEALPCRHYINGLHTIRVI